MNYEIIPMVGALGTTPTSLEKKKLKTAEPAVSIELPKKAAVLGTARILRKAVDTSAG